MEVVEEVLGFVADAAKRGGVRDRHLSVMVTLDVRNAFNTAPWHLIDVVAAWFGLPLYLREVIRSYLNDRRILLPGDDAEQEKLMTSEVLQGSILGPTLWNMFYDGLLRLQLSEGVSVVGVSEGVAMVTVNHTTEGLERATNRALETAGTWIDDQGLKLAHAKTESMVLTGKWAYRQPLLFSRGVQVLVMRMVKYLGFTLGSKLTFIRYIRVVSASAKASACVVGRLIPNIGGPSARKRKLLAPFSQAGSFTRHRRGHPG